MSDDEEYSYEYNDEDEEMDDEQSDFIYTDEDQDQDDIDVDVENAYYNAKGLKDTSLDDAAEAFEGVVTMERESIDESYGPWSYKAIKQLVKLYLRSGNATKMMTQYERLLDCISTGAVGQNAVEKGVNGILERVSSQCQDAAGRALAKNLYDSTLRTFNPRFGKSPNERLWFKTNLKLGQLLYEMNETAQLQLVIKDLLKSQGGQDGTERYIGTHLMEIYALQIQLYSRQKDNKKLREIFERAMRVEGGIPHPRTLALIQELGGKMHMASREFEAAGKTFFQAFKSYDEAGDPSRLRCLKYLVMASMLHASTINPFDSQEARPYKDDPEIVAMTNLVQAFHSNEIRKFEGILRQNQGKIMDDEFVREHVADLLRTIRTQVLRSVIAPYTRISLEFIARQLNGIPVEDVESLLVSLILDGKLDGRIDQVKGVLLKGRADTNNGKNQMAGITSAAPVSGEMWGGNSLDARNCASLEQLTSALEQLTTTITSVGGRSTYHQIM
mmetsp:Transcript_27637/g.33600  ORF Transcript_27637/g.33600 Transcript_27637/m.33600 type:complete len:501 (-) Transcript_27637:247-1749(-)|eukprot:CAMPEP_0172500688 /NCGR_PEP_ID=MMETSP1066-20121228/141861_1 /TAXON_ID=671091 /ORGANISM="Coscinodiscus wailesii, Strain CCMP2513" /LENGTH=500 /DNA_ID=CAMNT_0013275055 /DNA_START=175 /DNA_END=1677 /DNA_ORIENTATION=+